MVFAPEAQRLSARERPPLEVVEGENSFCCSAAPTQALAEYSESVVLPTYCEYPGFPKSGSSEPPLFQTSFATTPQSGGY